MHQVFQTLVYLHIIIGFISLVTFWIPVVAKKGGKLHIRSGHWYAKAMYGVGISAVILSSLSFIDPLGAKFAEHSFSPEKATEVIAKIHDTSLFLFAIAILTITNVRTGLMTLQAKRNHKELRAPNNLALNSLLLLVALLLAYNATGNSPLSVLFYIFSALCAFNAITNFRYIFKASVTRSDRIVAHLSNMIGAGIGAHTAFLLFGANRVISHLLVGYWGIVPWVLPGIVGGMIITVQTRKYRRAAKPA